MHRKWFKFYLSPFVQKEYQIWTLIEKLLTKFEFFKKFSRFYISLELLLIPFILCHGHAWNMLFQFTRCESLWLDYTCAGRGRTHLPKFKFSAKFPIGLHVIFKLQIKKNQNLFESDAQNYFKRKSVGVQPCTPLKIVLNGLCFQIIRQYVRC